MESLNIVNSLSGGKIMQKIQKKENFQNGGASFGILNFISLITMVIAGWLSWNKNSLIHPGNTGMNIFYAISAGLFGGIVYILFYLISMRELVDLAMNCRPFLVANPNFFK